MPDDFPDDVVVRVSEPGVLLKEAVRVVRINGELVHLTVIDQTGAEFGPYLLRVGSTLTIEVPLDISKVTG